MPFPIFPFPFPISYSSVAFSLFTLLYNLIITHLQRVFIIPI